MDSNWFVIFQEISSPSLQLGYRAQNYGHSQSENSGIFKKKSNMFQVQEIYWIWKFPRELFSISITYLHFRSPPCYTPCPVLSVPEGQVRDGTGNTLMAYLGKCGRSLRSSYTPNLSLSLIFSSPSSFFLFFFFLSNLYILTYYVST